MKVVNLVSLIFSTVLPLKRVLLSAKALTTVQIDVRLRCDFPRYENKIFRHAENVGRRNRVIDRVALQSDFYRFYVYGPVVRAQVEPRLPAKRRTWRGMTRRSLIRYENSCVNYSIY